MLALASAIVGRDPQGNGPRKTANGRPGRPVAVNRRDMDDLFARYTVDTLLHVRRDLCDRRPTSLAGAGRRPDRRRDDDAGCACWVVGARQP
jgi:hypothetical protein